MRLSSFCALIFFALLNSLLIASQKDDTYENYLESKKHNDSFSLGIDNKDYNLSIEKLNCDNLESFTSLTPFFDDINTEIKKNKIDYDRFFKKYNLVFGVCPKSEIQLLVLLSVASNLQEHALENSKKWIFPLTKQHAIELYKSTIAYEYWIHLNTLKQYKTQNDFLSMIPKEQTALMSYMSKLLQQPNFLNYAAIQKAYNELMVIKLKVLDDKITNEDITKNISSSIHELCSDKNLQTINELLTSKKQIPETLLNNIYGHIFFKLINRSFCEKSKFRMVDEYKNELKELLK